VAGKISAHFMSNTFLEQNSAICEPVSLNMTEQKLTKEMITYRFD